MTEPGGGAAHRNQMNSLCYPRLARYLATLDAEEHYYWIVANMDRIDAPGLRALTCTEVHKLLESFPYLSPEVPVAFQREFIDGNYLMHLDAGRWAALGLPSASLDYLLIKLQLQLIVSPESLLSDSVSIPVGENPLVHAGVIANLSNLPNEVAMAIKDADEQCIKTGEGKIYGSFTILGHKEFYRNDRDNRWVGVGLPNEVLVLQRRRVANGLLPDLSAQAHTDKIPKTNFAATIFYGKAQQEKFRSLSVAGYGMMQPQELSTERPCPTSMATNEISHTPTKNGVCVTIPFERDPSLDMFTIGRVPGNDLVVPGPLRRQERSRPTLLQIGSNSSHHTFLTSTVSRFGCRVLCERTAPFRTFLFAGGFNDEGQIVLRNPKLVDSYYSESDCLGVRLISRSVSSHQQPQQQQPVVAPLDALTNSGVRLWHPLLRKWTEVSFLGQVCSMSSDGQTDTKPFTVDLSLSNELVDGSIIEMGGVSILFRKELPPASQYQPEKTITRMNGAQPYCPVAFSPISFSFLPPRERAFNQFRNLENEGASYIKRRPFSVPATDTSGIEKGHRSMVFPACGHVHGFHNELRGRPCPLCRKVGPFVPVAFAFEATITGPGKPTHVFNPCGHVSNKETCSRWASIPLPDPGGAPMGTRYTPKCPFCAVSLVMEPRFGGPYNKMNIQVEQEENEELDETEADHKLPSPQPASTGMRYPKLMPAGLR